MMQPLGAPGQSQPTGWDPRAMAGSPFAAQASMMTGGGTPGNAGPEQGGMASAGPSPFAVPGATLTPFGPGRDLRGTAIMPGSSPALNQYDQFVQGAAGNVANTQFSPFQGVPAPTFGQERGMLAGSNAQMQGQRFDFTGANSAYGNAVTAQQGAQGQAGAILQGLGGAGGSFGGGGGQASTTRFNQELDGALEGLQGPNRGELAAQTMSLLEERTQPGFEAAQRQTGQRAAALGRIGSGMTTNDLTGVLQGRERMLDQSRRELATDAAGRTLDDRLQVANMQRGVAGDRFGGETFNAGLADNAAGRAQQGAMFGANLQRGVAGDLYGMGRDASNLQMGIGDRAGDQARDMTGLGERQAGFGRTIANDLGNFTRDTASFRQGERDSARSDEFGRAGFGLQALQGLGGVQDRQRNFEAGQRDETRGERGFQNDMANQAQTRAVQQQQFNEWLRNSGWNRTQQAGGLGFGNTPQTAYQQAANTTRSFFG